MARLIVTLLVILPAVLSAATEEKAKLPEVLPASGTAATGAAAVNLGQQTASSETHDKKNFGLNFSSDKGSSNTYSNTGLQAAAAGGVAQGVGYPGVYPHYPVFPIYPGWGGYPIYPGYPSVGSVSGVQLPGINAGSIAGVSPFQHARVPVPY